jgi:hypothetical protein
MLPVHQLVPRPPASAALRGTLQAFLRRARGLQRFHAGRARLLFAMDATASRQPTWDLAVSLQADMFRASADVAPLAIQLAYYRGLGELHFDDWQADAEQLARRMSAVRCMAGRTQIARLLRTVRCQQTGAAARALVFIGDAMEEEPTIARRAGGPVSHCSGCPCSCSRRAATRGHAVSGKWRASAAAPTVTSTSVAPSAWRNSSAPWHATPPAGA